MLLRHFLLFFAALSLQGACSGQKETGKDKASPTVAKMSGIIPAADQPGKYLPLLRGKKVALLVNHTSTVGGTHIVDAMVKEGITIKVVFGPEHGFRGDAPDGAKIESTTDPKTGVSVVSLYGKKTKPSPEDLRDVDVMVYDIQDVGTRFYTFISSLQYYMEAALENNIPLIILDRPNPNGFYVDGPVLEPPFKSFVGMQPVPVVYGMTTGEYANMILLEGWLGEAANRAFEKLKLVRYREGAKYFQLTVIPVVNYTHKSKYVLPVSPSPNLPEIQSIYWYPSTCFFEGTALSEGRGTPKPFQYIGHPALPQTMFQFTPASTKGAPEPKLKGKQCYGYDLSGTPAQVVRSVDNRLQLKYLLEAYRLFPDKEAFFPKNSSFNRLAGNDKLMQQVMVGKSEQEIRASWEPALSQFKKIRKRYLLYPDFE